MSSAVTGPTTRPRLDEDLREDPRLADLGSTPTSGLTAAEAARRTAGLGNDARIGTGRTYLEIVRDNALNPVNILLVAISAVLAVLGLWGDAAVTIVLVLVNVVVGVYQEGRAKQTLDRLSILTRPTATIVRDGVQVVADQHDVVLGDALVVKLGDQLMLDGRVIDGEMELDESLLTGEPDRIPSGPATKCYRAACASAVRPRTSPRGSAASPLPIDLRPRHARVPRRPDAHPARRREGDAGDERAGGDCCDTGAHRHIPAHRWDRAGRDGTRRGGAQGALVPQGLIVMVTVTYALAIIRLAGGKALIQRSSAVESMSRVDVLCLDKTGTLTTPFIELVRTQSYVDEAKLKAFFLGDARHAQRRRAARAVRRQRLIRSSTR